MVTYRAAILGVGPRGLKHGRAYRQHPRIDLVALCDMDAARLAHASQELGVERTYGDYREMLDREDPDIVSIPTRTDLHAPLTMGVLAHRPPRAIDVEKPMATSLADADRMVAEAARTGTLLAVHHQFRCTPPFRVAARMIEAGEIGPITTIKLRGKGYYGGYDLMNIGTHRLNGTRAFLGRARSVSAICTTAGEPTGPEGVIAGPYGFGWIAGENISAVYDFEGGGTVFAEFHRRSESNRGWGHIKIYGEDGAICLYNQMNMQVRRGRDWRVEDVNWELLKLTPADRILHGVDYLDEPGGDLWMADETVHALDQDRPHENSGEEGLAVMEMLLGAWESHFTERRVGFPMRRGAHPLLQARTQAGLGEPDPAPMELRYPEWLPGELARIGADH